MKLDNLTVRQFQYRDLDSPQLSIIDLLLVNTFVAATVAAITGIGLIGVHLLLVVCLLVNVHHVFRFDRQPRRFRFWNQFVWIILMPLACIFGDPFVFGQFEFGRVIFVTDYGFACYFFVGWQMLVTAGSWYTQKSQNLLNEFIAGTLFAGSFFAFAVGICLLPLTLIGTLAMGLGVPGIIPWFTGMVLLNTSKMHWRRVGENNSKYLNLWLVGAFLPVVVSITIFLLANAMGFEIGTSGDFVESPLNFLE